MGLQELRQTARTSRKNEKKLHTWSFYRLAQYIEYKAGLSGIKVEYVGPKYTSQICPECGEKTRQGIENINAHVVSKHIEIELVQ